MPGALANQILEKLHYVAEIYYPLILVVAPSGAGKTEALGEVSRKTGASLINLNLELSRRMLELTERQRALQLPSLISEIADQEPGDVVLLDNIEILFEVSLQSDPLRLLQKLSRHKKVIASWNGTYEEGCLIYAEVGHPEYRKYYEKDLIVVTPTD